MSDGRNLRLIVYKNSHSCPSVTSRAFLPCSPPKTITSRTVPSYLLNRNLPLELNENWHFGGFLPSVVPFLENVGFHPQPLAPPNLAKRSGATHLLFLCLCLLCLSDRISGKVKYNYYVKALWTTRLELDLDESWWLLVRLASSPPWCHVFLSTF